ncbi:MAG: acyl-CoA dehydrogenase family protein [Gammaproteobacteria bacterium]|uniref:acyl-CoA dehydrogenase family protein n=1 Tax=Rhodoferax sp. TaxID=50421 RepID=UPI001802E4F7|nr:acyl-CoA dehydrogenase family protein [Rhodoferax sp.]MBU3897876.1 acyl-CoA dehydrogenase family protein [Gammaproteobacteria bacterium]MBA3057777.1 pimeloyl-CoA dehydrogenase small subunit [Rhodoferax sp.]MBU3998888.1 acyl-CoA dehydrogenase family protein [Gammaproteobacteria bacterium]MBU4019447.1 acyl-CoA dehydrogenase family protein [Gammaproteobacteria bacterium]MBU4080769.1 acyl-CoA dehydrogenase family protein [Gammaproteobacteria bacterium]
MNFEHTEERRMLADSLNRFIAEQYTFEKRDQIAKSPNGFSPEIWQNFADLGVIGALFREADGGFGGGGFDIAVVFEALGRGLVVEPLLGSAVLAGEAIASAGDEAQKTVLADIIGGTTIAALAHDEPDSHYELARVLTRAERSTTGWVLNGAKAVVLQGEQADLFVVSARTAGAADDEAGISLFLVSAKAPGLVVLGCPSIDGGRVAELSLSGVALGTDALLGAEGQGYATLERAIGRGVLALCAESLGAMEAAKSATLEYLRTRKQFGVFIGSFQALQHRMADLLLEIEQARSAVINAAAALDADRLTRERALSAAKFSIGRIGALVSEESIQMHGGIGMTWELPLAHYAKRLIMIDHQLGDEDHHLQRFIALGKQMAV